MQIIIDDRTAITLALFGFIGYKLYTRMAAIRRFRAVQEVVEAVRADPTLEFEHVRY